MNLLDKARNIFIFILYLAIFIIFGAYLNVGCKQYRDMVSRLDTIENNITYINEEINNIRETASDTDAKIENIENTLIDTIDTEIDNYITEINEVVENEAVEEETVSKNYSNTSNTSVSSNVNYSQDNDSDVLTASKGVNYYGNQKETYYNLNMDGVISIAKSQGIQGEYWVREDGVKMYGDYVIVAANLDTHPRGTTVETSLGTGIVLDTGGFAASDPNQVDIATAW